MNTENIAHYFYGSAPAEDELMNAVFSGENTVDALKTAANQHEFLYTEKIRLWNELHMALVGCPGTEPISHEPLSQAIVGVDFVDDGQVAYTLLEDLDDIVSALNEVDEDAFLDKYLQQNGVENRDAALAEFRTLRDFYRQANGLSCGSVILLEQLRTIDKSRLRERVGALDTSEMKQIDWALGVSVGLVEGYR